MYLNVHNFAYYLIKIHQNHKIKVNIYYIFITELLYWSLINKLYYVFFKVLVCDQIITSNSLSCIVGSNCENVF